MWAHSALCKRITASASQAQATFVLEEGLAEAIRLQDLGLQDSSTSASKVRQKPAQATSKLPAAADR